MTTYISLASSTTVFPVDGLIRCSALTPELVKARLEKVQVVSLVNRSHATTIDAIRRRFDIAVPLPDDEALPQAVLAPGDELFVIQATVDSAPMSLHRWRVPVRVDVKAPEGPNGLPQTVFDQVIDHAHSIALWRGRDHLNTLDILSANFAKAVEEFNAAWSAWCSYGGSQERGKDYECDVYLKWADIAYHGLCLWHQGERGSQAAWWQAMRDADENIDHHRGLDVMLAKYARRAASATKDIEAERALATSILG